MGPDRPAVDATASDTRRQMLTKLGVGAGLVWAAPMVTTFKASAQAVGSGPGETTTSTTTAPTTTTTTPPPVDEPLAFSTGWASERNGYFAGGQGALGFAPFFYTEEANGSAPQHVVEQDAEYYTSTVRISKSIELVGGRTYTFTFESRGYSNNDVKQTVTASIGGSSLTINSGSYQPEVWHDVHTLEFTPSASGPYTFSFLHSVPPGTGDDVGVTAPVVTWR